MEAGQSDEAAIRRRLELEAELAKVKARSHETAEQEERQAHEPDLRQG